MDKKKKSTATAVVLADKFVSEREKNIFEDISIPVIEHILIQLTRIFSKVLISANDIEKYLSLSLPIIPDMVTNVGNVMGIISCLDASLTDMNFFISCHNPEMDDDFVMNMLNHGMIYDAVIPCHSGKIIEPLFGVYKKSTLPLLRRAIDEGEVSFPGVLKYLNVKYFDLEGQDWFVNIENMENYQNYLDKILKQ